MNPSLNARHAFRLKQFDEEEDKLWKMIAQVQEERREYINRNGLNKPAQEYTRG